MKLINRADNIFNDNIAFVEQYDFSTANLNEENRVKAVTTVASICYQSPKAIGNVNLYDKLGMENKGLPSSSYEFVPVLISADFFNTIKSEYDNENLTLDVERYGEWVENDTYLLSNLRALISDLGQDNVKNDYFNTEEECVIIAKYFKVFKSKIDLPTRSQLVRHRTSSPQELSRRYVSGEKLEFEFYIPEELDNVISRTDSGDVVETNEVISMCLTHYYAALKANVKPEAARRIIPQAAYTEIWHAWLPRGLNVFNKLRLDSHAQWEINRLAFHMNDMIKGDDGFAKPVYRNTNGKYILLASEEK